MATHGTCDTDGPGPQALLPFPARPDKGHYRRVQARQRRPLSGGNGATPKPALPDHPAIMALRTGRDLNPYFILAR